MKMDNKNIRLVGDLQDYGVPYSSLYIDIESRKLYIFVRVSPPDCSPIECAATEVSPQDINEYIDENIGISTFFERQDYGFVKLENGQIKHSSLLEDLPDERMKKMNYVDPDFYYDEVWLEVFLKRLVERKPLEIV